jgi:predicted alpha-1,6-mannanase (GH76 family)
MIAKPAATTVVKRQVSRGFIDEKTSFMGWKSQAETLKTPAKDGID